MGHGYCRVLAISYDFEIVVHAWPLCFALQRLGNRVSHYVLKHVVEKEKAEGQNHGNEKAGHRRV